MNLSNTTEITDLKIDTPNSLPENLGFFRFKTFGDSILLTGEAGEFQILSHNDFNHLVNGTLPAESKLFQILIEKGFILGAGTEQKLIRNYQSKYEHIFYGPSLFAFGVDLQCDHSCSYCQVSRVPIGTPNVTMPPEIARKAVDIAFSGPSRVMAFEFQGGEPLINYPIIQFIVNYANEKNKEGHKDIQFRLVSNLRYMDDEKIDWLFNHKVTICTSFDGPKHIHNKHRITKEIDSYQNVITQFSKVMARYELEQTKCREQFLPDPERPGALITCTRDVLNHPREVVEEYINLKIETIFLRPLVFLGFAKRSYNKSGYSAQEFFDFHKKVLDVMFEKNDQGIAICEAVALCIIAKIILRKDGGNVDFRSPWGQIVLFAWDGKVFNSDEARMLEDDHFLVGTVDNSYDEIVSNPNYKIGVISSLLDNTTCEYCVYKPYCGIHPLKLYAEQNTLTPNIIDSFHCQYHKLLFEYIFECLQDSRKARIIETWIERFILKNHGQYIN